MKTRIYAAPAVIGLNPLNPRDVSLNNYLFPAWRFLKEKFHVSRNCSLITLHFSFANHFKLFSSTTCRKLQTAIRDVLRMKIRMVNSGLKRLSARHILNHLLSL